AGALLVGLTPMRAHPQTTGAGSDPGLRRLEAEIERLAVAARGTVGVAAIHLETGRSAYVNRAVAFPMASTYKVPIAVQLLTMVDEGKLSLDSMVTVPQEDVYRTASTISDLLHEPGLALSVRNLLELMLRVSDNIATDVLFRTAGGSRAITGRMRALGLANTRVDRPTWALISAFVGRPDITEENRIYPADYLALLSRQRTPEEQAAHTKAFNEDPRDTTTPEEMGALLTRIWQREILSAESTNLLLDIMYRCDTGPGRIKGILPPGTRVAHKTGTIGETTNDVGIIDLPGGAGHVVAVVYIKESKLPNSAAMEPVIAQISRAIHDYFAFNPGS
ncbi:MAG: class A beta-lactamase, partial [Longimicrobiales bacterium]|nr:class A beta-lactamase [Longimicrobiales bacterium]